MSDNVLQTLHKLVQDAIAPDVRELKVRVESIEKQFDCQHEGNSFCVSEWRAQSELSVLTAVSSLRERVAVLESKHNRNTPFTRNPPSQVR